MNSRVAIAGVGGDGFQLGLKLAQMGVQTFDIADPEVFEPENTNRVPGATNSTWGRKKAEVFEEKVKDINPNADVRIFETGVTVDNVEDFTNRATLLFDESELTYLHIGTSLARAARERGIPEVLVMNVGFSALVTSFKPGSKYTFEKMMGIPKDMPLEEVKGVEVDFSRCLPYVPKYGDIKTLESVRKGASLPSIAQGVDVASAIGTSQAFLHMVRGLDNNRPEPVWAPRMAFIDAYSMQAGITRMPRLSHYHHLGRAVANNLLGRHSRAAYTEEDRQRRAQATL